MTEKTFILNADDFGLSQAHNKAVLEGYVNGFLRSASICTNGEGFYSAVHDILPDCPELSLAPHLNIIEGKALTDCPDLTDDKGNFNISFGYLLLHKNEKTILEQVEKEFRAQIERLQEFRTPTHLDSHVHVHAIPEIFEITCRLAKDFGIKYVRTQFEELYFIPKFEKHLNIKYPLNLIKIGLLQYFTRKNREISDKYGLKTNDFILGVGYSGMMESDAIIYGLEQIEEDCLVEASIHPCKYDNSTRNSHTKEFAITQNKNLSSRIESLGFKIANYNNLD